MPLCNIKFPANAGMFNNFMMEIAIFDIIPSEMILEKVSYFPQEDNFNLNFQTIGYNSLYAVPNLGTIFFMVLSFLMLVPLALCMTCFSHDVREIRKPTNSLNGFLYWKGTVRFLMETYMELMLAVTLNIAFYNSETGYVGVSFSNWFAIFFFVLTIGVPIWIIIFFYCK